MRSQAARSARSTDAPGRGLAVAAAVAAVLLGAPRADAAAPSRDETRELVRQALTEGAPRLGTAVVFHETKSSRYRYAANLDNLASMQRLEILVDVDENDTVTVRAYPRMRDAYVALASVADREAYLLELARLSGQSFFAWALDADDDLVVLFRLTLESGFPVEAFDVVLRSLRNVDAQFATLLPHLGPR